MAQESTIRIRQLNQTELSGFIAPIIQGFLSQTGALTGVFYPLRENPSGYEASGAFISQEDLDSAVAQTISYIADNFYPNSNPSGYTTQLGRFDSLIFNCSSGVTTERFVFPVLFETVPNVVCSFNSPNGSYYGISISGVTTSGFFVNYGSAIDTTGYKISSMAHV
jgi:hypothetical protein